MSNILGRMLEPGMVVPLEIGTTYKLFNITEEIPENLHNLTVSSLAGEWRPLEGNVTAILLAKEEEGYNGLWSGIFLVDQRVFRITFQFIFLQMNIQDFLKMNNITKEDWFVSYGFNP